MQSFCPTLLPYISAVSNFMGAICAKTMMDVLRNARTRPTVGCRAFSLNKV